MSDNPVRIGREGKPIRALTFPGGGYSTALQLGVAHALMVNRGRAPDIVAGISAGAVNAVALAEILQAADGAGNPLQGRERQVARFRTIFEAYRCSPGAMASALLPDSLQIDTRRPLEAMKLPIHVKIERDLRDAATRSRSGLMNLYNKLLDLRLPLGTVARVLRRWLGIQFARELAPFSRLCATIIAEVLHLLNLAGLNLLRLAPTGSLFFWAAVRSEARPPEGGTAGELISRSPVWESLLRGVVILISLLVLATLWVVATAIALPLGGVVLLFCGIGLGGVRVWRWWRSRKTLEARDVASFFRGAGRLAESASKLVTSLVTCWALWAVVLASIILLPRSLSWISNQNAVTLPWIGSVTVAVTLLVISLAALILLLARWSNLRLNILRRNTIADGLFDPHPVRELFVRLFDRDYYGRLDMSDVVEAALRDQPATSPEERDPKTLNTYAQPTRKTPMRVAVIAANVATGKLETISESAPVVDALLAATAIAPLYRPQKICNHLYVDGANVANEVTWPLLDMLKDQVARGGLNLDASSLHIYNTSPLQLSRQELDLDDRERAIFKRGAHVPLIYAVSRAWKLQRFRDATLERRLTELHTRAMPAGDKICFPPPDGDGADTGGPHLRAWFYPIEPDRPLAVDRRLLEAKTEEDRRTVIAETVATGCRAAMERMLLGVIRETAGEWRERVCCSDVIQHRLAAIKDEEQRAQALPGADEEGGPGLSEVCRHCRLVQKDASGRSLTHERMLDTRPHETTHPPDWPLEDDDGKTYTDPQVRLITDYATERETTLLYHFKDYKKALDAGEAPAQWPAPRTTTDRSGLPSHGDTASASRPTISLLFSGGVFRGVFQVGVINALSEIGLRPDIVAGASIGSITAAMTARLFSGGNDPEARTKMLRELAATYMAVDRLVLTDRFADFVRTMTVQAAQAEFSLKQFDRFTRRYDQPRSGVFSREARRVMAGLERLFHISPFELRILLQAMRLRKRHHVVRLLREYFQEWLDRGGVGDEILGAEPLSLLINKHVLEGLPQFDQGDPDATTIDQFLADGIVLLATATNLVEGKLETIGLTQLGPKARRVSLHQALLASSAFPGVFRPRWSWEVFPDSHRADLLADGGVMDNLPFDAIAEFLNYSAAAGLIKAIPENPSKAPHLIFSASLRADPELLDEAKTERLESNWPELLKRTGQLGYNQKLALYEREQRDLRRITRALGKDGQRVDPDLDPLSIEVVTVRPKWLCGTFAFHPMLGFKRDEQARNIAHGCASTLWKMGSYASQPTQKEWLREWDVNVKRLPQIGQKPSGQMRPLASKRAGMRGKCWFNEKFDCPFRKPKQDESDLGSAATEQVSKIHEFCGLPETHARRE